MAAQQLAIKRWATEKLYVRKKNNNNEIAAKQQKWRSRQESKMKLP